MNRRRFVGIGWIALLGILPGTPGVSAEWPQWGGPRRDFAIEAAKEIEPWPAAGPPVLWRQELGPGYAGVVVGGEHPAGLITMTRRGDQEVLVALAIADGRRLWEHAYAAPVRPDPAALDTSYGAGPNGTPLIAGRSVVALGFTGILSCVRLSDGKPLWTRDLTQLGVRAPYFGHASSPVRHGDSVIVVAGGAHAFDLQTGEPRWSNTSFAASYASPVLIDRGAKRLLLIAGAGEVVGLDPDDGTALWRQDHANDQRTILSSPVTGGDGWAFVSAYFIGSIGLQLSEDGRSATKRWENSQLQLSHTNAVRDGDRVYGFHNSTLTAIDVTTGEIRWRHRGMQKSNLLRVGKRFLLLDNLGRLTLASFGVEGMETLASSQVYEGRAWTAPTFHEGVLYVRTEEALMALDLRGGKPGPERQAAVVAEEAGPLEVPDDFMDARRRLTAALHAWDRAGLEAGRAEFSRWTSHADMAPLAHYYIGLAAWAEALAADRTQARALADASVDSLRRALRLRREFADAHALLSQVFSLYWRVDPRRAAIIGPQGDEHLQLALLQEPRNPRVVAAHAADLLNSPTEHGGDPQAGLARLREALVLFESTPVGASSAEPGWGHALTWESYGRALLGRPEPDREGARAAFQRALTIEPGLATARQALQELQAVTDDDTRIPH